MTDATLEALPNPVIIYDEDWNVNQANKSALDFLGVNGFSDLQGKNIRELFAEKDLAEIHDVQEFTASQNIFRPKRELHHIHQQGHEIQILAHFSKISSQKEPGRFKYVESGLAFGEILEWHHQEFSKLQCYKTLAENVPGLDMFLIDRRYNIKCSVGSETHKQGWTQPDSDRKNVKDHFSAPILRILLPLLKIAFEATPVSREFEAGKDYYSARLIPLLEDQVEISCVVILQNITDTKLAEEKLKVSKKEADEANMAKGNFIAKMSHEIRTPLNAIIGFSEQLKKTRLTKKQSNYLNVIHNSSEHLLSIIDEILVLSKIDSRQITFEEIPFRISKVLKAVNDVVELKYKEKGLDYKTIFDLSVDQVLLGDPARLRQILINLVNNAIKFTEKGRVVLSCNATENTEKIMSVRFEISDTGIGIAKDDLENIFKPFHQVDNTIGRNYSGTGLGLTISKDLVEKQGGKLQARSTPGKGSKFGFTLTFNKTDRIEPETEEEKIPVDELALEKLHILFVDDDPVNRMLGNVILSDLKIKTDFAASGEEAISMFTPGKYDMVLLDINMPGTNGVDVARHIRNNEHRDKPEERTKIIAMTANVLKSHIEQYMQAGMDDIILKPFREENIYEKIAVLRPKNLKLQLNKEEIKAGQDSSEDFNLEELQRITRGDNEFTLLMLNTFIENSNNLLKEIESAFEKNDYPAMAEAAHRLLPSMEQLKIKKATALLRKVENTYLRKKTYQEKPQMIQKTIEEVQHGIRLIKKAKTKLMKQM